MVLVGLYLVLTLVLLHLASIDAVNFDAHEVYGAPFVLSVRCSDWLMYTGRKGDSQQQRMAWSLGTACSVVRWFASVATGRRLAWTRTAR